MNDHQRNVIKDYLDKITLEKTISPEIAKNWLIEIGIYDINGNLKPEYGGEIHDQREEISKETEI